MRGRLIWAFYADIARLDTVGTSADPDSGGPYTSGYDHDYREPVRLPGGASARVELPVVSLPCQVEIVNFEKLSQRRIGNDPVSQVRLVYHFADLEELGLVNAVTGKPMLNIGDRLVAIRRWRDQSLVQHAGLAEGLYCTEVQPQSFGLSGLERNILCCTYDGRDATTDST